MRVLFVTSEVAPLVKTGGLADVSAALPAALRRIGDDVKILIPGYTQVLKALDHFKVDAFFTDVIGFPDFRLFSSHLADGVPVWVIDCPELFQREGGIYQNKQGLDWEDNALRFALLSKVAALLASPDSPFSWRPEIVHCNDWQTGLTPAYMHFSASRIPTVMTVHNLAFQGVFPPENVEELGLPAQSFNPYGLEYYGYLSFLKAGLYYANHLTTVSPSYAAEIQTEALGFGMQGLLKNRRQHLTGILNGIDEQEWNPEADSALVQGYSVADMAGKAANKLELQKLMGLNQLADRPLFGLVGRFTHQKGLDIVLEIAPQLAAAGAQLVLLGSGDAGMQTLALDLAKNYPGQIAAFVGFDEKLSHLIEAGSDLFLMPSRFEPCGLNQMYSQRYGTPPIVHATGGLIDSVVDCNPANLAAETASGFVFQGLSAENLFACCMRAMTSYHDKITWSALCKNGMRKNFGWHESATQYHQIYVRLT